MFINQMNLFIEAMLLPALHILEVFSRQRVHKHTPCTPQSLFFQFLPQSLLPAVQVTDRLMQRVNVSVRYIHVIKEPHSITITTWH